MQKKAFHLALPCKNIAKTKDFYLNILGAKAGREATKWIDINLFGNQITFTQAGDFNFDFKNYRLGEHVLPSFHFGVIVDLESWGKIYTKLLKSSQEVTSQVTFFEEKSGKHLSFFVKDPNGYMVEFKSFNDPDSIFAIQ
jgi:extradiol dioxygenase family protein